MNPKSRKFRLTHVLWLAITLLATQSMLLLHTHEDDKHVNEAGCELCVQAKHHTPGPTTVPPQLLAIVTLIELHHPVESAFIVSDIRFNYTPRAPPLFSIC